MKKNNESGLIKFIVVAAVIAGIYFWMRSTAKRRTEPDSRDANNPYLTDDVEEMPEEEENRYRDVVKPALDHVLSFAALVLLSPLFALIAVAVYVDDPGPVFFTQSRVGKDKHFFSLHKFRTMKMSTPHDVPTHQLQNPEKYITRVGAFLRRTSLDELPQIWEIFRGRMSIVGPRPALYNQDDLVAERDKYGANHMMPGLTGLAQISGRDELEIPVKAKYDGEYTEALNRGGLTAAWMDLKCFFGTFYSVLSSRGVVEGGTGQMRRTSQEIHPTPVMPDAAVIDTSSYNQKTILLHDTGAPVMQRFHAYALTQFGKNFTILTDETKESSSSKYAEDEADAVISLKELRHDAGIPEEAAFHTVCLKVLSG